MMKEELMQECEQMQWKSITELSSIQWIKTKQLLEYAYRNVEFYRKRFDDARITPEDIRYPEDYLKVPLTSKEELREAFKDGSCIASGMKPKLLDKTSGSTNEPLHFYKDEKEEMIEHCATLRNKMIAGYIPGQPCALMRGVNPNHGLKLLIDRARNRHFIDLKRLDAKTIPKIARMLKRKRFSMIDCFPSGILEIARYCIEKKIDVKIGSVIVSGEKVSSKEIHLIEKAFQTKVFEKYGSAECMEVAFQCEMRKGMHVDVARFNLEIIDDGKPAGVGEVILTNLCNFTMPFIRYRIGDEASWLEGECGCGRDFPRISGIRGRVVKNLVTKDGKVMNYHFFTTMMEKHFESIKRYQILLQPSKVTLNVIPSKGWDDKVRKSISDEMRSHIGTSIDFEVNEVQEIRRAPSGKMEMLRQE